MTRTIPLVLTINGGSSSIKFALFAAIEEGRATFQRILTYTLRSLVHRVVQVLFLAAGLIITARPS